MRPENSKTWLEKLASANYDEESSSSDEDFVCNTDEQTDDDDSETDSSADDHNDDSLSESSSAVSSPPPKKKIEKQIEKIKLLKSKAPTNGVEQPSKIAKQPDLCCVCLNEKSYEQDDELVSCDSCGFFTHEGCYGITDTNSTHSNVSSASTEPWFCNSCLYEDQDEPISAIKKIIPKYLRRRCELCPNIECGLMTQCDNGKFVHIVCALYTTGVKFQDTDKLWPAVLDEIPPVRWGEQACTLCDDVKYSRTGVSIKCDAGLCKTYFHVTCAQKHGCLLDPSINPDEPFVPYCKQHNEKAVMTNRKLKYSQMISNYNSVNSSANNQRLFEINQDKERMVHKFNRAKDKYELERQKVQKPFNLTIKKPRYLTSSPTALKFLNDKYSLSNPNGHDDHTTAENFYNEQPQHSASSVTFTTGFVKYYLDRESTMPQLYKQLKEHKDKQIDLSKQEVELRNKHDSIMEEKNKHADDNLKMKNTLKDFVSFFELLAPKSADVLFDGIKSKLSAHLNDAGSISNKKELEKNPSKRTRKSKKEPTKSKESNSSQTSISPNTSKTSETIQQATTQSTSRRKSKKPVKKASISFSLNLDSECCECNKKIDVHKLVDCDTCKKYYHIFCLNPPLESVPKKTKLYGWECSKCVRKKDQSSSEDLNDTNILDVSQRSRRERKPSKRENGTNIDLSSLIVNTSSGKASKRPFKKEAKKRKSETKKSKKSKSHLVAGNNSAHASSNNVSEAIYIDDDDDDDNESNTTATTPPNKKKNKI